MTAQCSHQGATKERRIGLSSRTARANAALSHSSHAIAFGVSDMYRKVQMCAPRGDSRPRRARLPPTKLEERNPGGATIIIMMGMIVLRYLYMLALVAWLGGMLALAGLAAPSIFTVLEHQGTAVGHLLAGAVFSDIQRRFQLAACVCGVVMLATLVGMRLLGPRPVHFAAQFATVFAMSAISMYSAFGGL